jgi:hypothetical protein
MSRPLEIFLYDWWPIRTETRLLDRLAAMPVRLTYAADAPADAWRYDWPGPALAADPLNSVRRTDTSNPTPGLSS